MSKRDEITTDYFKIEFTEERVKVHAVGTHLYTVYGDNLFIHTLAALDDLIADLEVLKEQLVDKLESSSTDTKEDTNG